MIQSSSHLSALNSTVFYNARGKSLMFLLLSLIFVAIGVLMIVSDDGIGGWFVSGFFGLCALVFAVTLFDRRPRLILDRTGITDRTLGVGQIVWSDIEHAALRSVSGSWFIELALPDEPRTRYLAQLSESKRRLSRGNRLIGFADLNINLTGLNARPSEVFLAFTDYRRTATARNSHSSASPFSG